MNDSIKIRPARSAEIPALAKLILNQLPDMMAGKKRPDNIEAQLARLVPDQSLIIATTGNRLAGLSVIDLDRCQVMACYLDPDVASPETPRQLFGAAEKLAISHGARMMYCTAKKQVSGFMAGMGYQPEEKKEPDSGPGRLVKDLMSRAKPELKALLAQLDGLGLPKDYGLKHRMRLMPEASTLVSVGRDIYERDQRLNPAAATAWSRMKTAAAGRGIELQLVSAFRTVSYQVNLIQRKLDEGQSIQRILSTSAAPGYSEHHSGRAIDITTIGQKPLNEDFSKTKAYDWLKANAGIYGFKESYPHNNRHRIQWEPWHWCYHRRPGR